jgi:hypothetical protein
MQDIFAPLIPCEDPLTHTVEQPFCKVDPSCICQEDQENIGEVNQLVRDGLLTPDEATRTVKGEQI